VVPLHQQKMLAPGRLRRWEVDLEAMATCAGWSRRRPDLLRQEVSQVLEVFPTFLAALGRSLPEERTWVEAAEPVLCPKCGELVVFRGGIRCVDCGREVAPDDSTVVGLIGRIPAVISNRPLLPALHEQLGRLRRLGDPRGELYERALLDINGREYLAPRFGLWFARSWPYADPPVMVWPEYFEMLGLPPDHVFPAPPYFRLCLYASWLEQPAVNVLQNRVAPRLLIDLMMADLNATGKLELALEQLDASLYQVYNMVGHPERGARLRQVYDELVGHD
jgi:hypothetical protein